MLANERKSAMWQGEDKGPTRHQPNEKPITVSRGEGGEERRGGPLDTAGEQSMRDEERSKQ